MIAADLRAVRSAARHVESLTRPEPTQQQLRDTRYWDLMRSGLTNTAACKILGVSRRLGSRIRQRSHYQTVASAQPDGCGRYLSLSERLKIADLLGFGRSLRRIALDLGRSPSTVKRELDRHRDVNGRYLPQSAGPDSLTWPRCDVSIWTRLQRAAGLVTVDLAPPNGGGRRCRSSRGPGVESRVELFATIRRDARVEELSIRQLAEKHRVCRRRLKTRQVRRSKSGHPSTIGE